MNGKSYTTIFTGPITEAEFDKTIRDLESKIIDPLLKAVTYGELTLETFEKGYSFTNDLKARSENEQKEFTEWIGNLLRWVEELLAYGQEVAIFGLHKGMICEYRGSKSPENQASITLISAEQINSNYLQIVDDKTPVGRELNRLFQEMEYYRKAKDAIESLEGDFYDLEFRTKLAQLVKDGKFTGNDIVQLLKGETAKKFGDPERTFFHWVAALMKRGGREMAAWSLVHCLRTEEIDNNGKPAVKMEFIHEDRCMEYYQDHIKKLTGDQLLGKKGAPKGSLVNRDLSAWTPSTFFAAHKALSPRIWDLVNPKIYKGVDRWHDPRYVSCAIAASYGFIEQNYVDEVAEPGEVQQDLKSITVLDDQNKALAMERAIIGSMMIEHQMPLFFVEPELARAAWMTEPPAVVDWKALMLPFEAAAFVLPRNLIKDVRGNDIPFFLYGRVKGGDQQHIKMDKMTFGADVDRDSFLISTVSIGAYVDSFRELVAPYKHSEEFGFLDNSTNYYSESEDGVEMPMTEKDIEFNMKMCGFVFNILMMMQEKHEAVKVTPTKFCGRHKKTKAELWTPKTIGQGYKIKRYSEGSGIPTGIHVRWHWRSGHWRRQGYGRLLCKNCRIKDHGPSWHNKETGECKHNDCLGICLKHDYEHEFHYDKLIEPILVNRADKEAEDGKGN